MLRPSRILLTLAAVVAATTLGAVPAAAQKPGNKYREFPAYGFRFKPLKDWLDVPVREEMGQRGMIAQFKAEKPVYVKVEGNRRPPVTPMLDVIKLEPKKASTDSGSKSGGLRGEVEVEKTGDYTAKDLVLEFYGGNLRKAEFAEAEVEEETVRIKKGFEARRERVPAFLVSGGIALDMVFDVWTFPLADFKAVFVWTYPLQDQKAWGKAVERSMKSFKVMEVEEELGSKPEGDDDYEKILAYHQREVAQTPGWRIVETPSKRFIIKTSLDDKRKIREIIQRLEASRDLFEKDFPPEEPIEHVSVVRICSNAEEFHTYGGTGGGVAGWFNPRTTELVLYFDPNSSKEFANAVMTHEGFHQYCHFLFHEAEAHRWFDEGHGDYYGGFDLKGRRLVADDKMPSGLDRKPEIKRMVREGTYKPISVHIRQNHPQWQNQGPTNVSCYAQSWSIIYFLRQGMERKVSRKYWKEEYADIIPNYIRVLSTEYAKALSAARAERQALLDEMIERGASKEDIARMRETLKDIRLGEQERSRIWAQAMAESWGKIDEDEFEERWKAYVLEEL